MDNVFIAIDPAATRLAAVVLLSDGWRIHTRTMPKDAVQRAVVADTWAHRVVSAYVDLGPVYVGVEDVVMHSGSRMANAAIPGAKVHAACLVGATRAGGVAFPINNTVWKKSIVGKGNADKPMITKYVMKHWPSLYRAAMQTHVKQDLCDAACMVQHVKKTYKARDEIAARTALRLSRGGSRRAT